MKNYCIVSHKHRFIYVPIAKVGCTTLLNRIAEIITGSELALANASSHRDVHSRRREIFTTKESEVHADCVVALRQYRDYFRFAFVRDPFTRIHSCYVDKLSDDTYGYDQNLVRRYPSMYRGMSFVAFLQQIKRMDVADMDEHFRPQWTFLPSDELDFIAGLENMESDWRYIERRLGWPPKELSHYNRTQMTDHYTDEAETLVGEIYWKDFDRFDYPARRSSQKGRELHLPIEVGPRGDVDIEPFKDVFVSFTEDAVEVTVTGNDPRFIIPYFHVREGKGILLAAEVESSIDTSFRVYFTDRDTLRLPESKHRSIPVHAGSNRVEILLNEPNAAGRLRVKPADAPCTLRIAGLTVSERTLPWLEDKDDLTPTTQRIFDLPEYAQNAKNLFSMVNYASLYMPIMDAVRPQHICEIGSEGASNTGILAEYCMRRGAALSVVDPVEPTLGDLRSGEVVRYFKERSVDFLRRPDSRAEVYFLDGDHNYQTVIEELRLIDGLVAEDDRPVCVFMHDTSWPWGYRDLFYAPEALGVDEETYTRSKGVSMYSAQPVDDGLESHNCAVSVTEGGPHNGVRRALLDFLDSVEHWTSSGINSLYGFTVLWVPERLGEDQTQTFDRIEGHFRYFQEFLSILEWNRLALMIENTRKSRTWEQNQSYIRRLRARVAAQAEEQKRKTRRLGLFGALTKRRRG